MSLSEDVLMFTPGHAEIIRSTQKDFELLQRLKADVKTGCQYLQGDLWWLRWHRRLDGFLTYLYFMVTTLEGSQTVGEEYAGLIQSCGNLRPPGRLRRLLMVLLHVFLPVWLRRVLLQSPGLSDQQSPLRLLALLPFLLQHMHVTLFYLTAGPYLLSQRLTGVHYLSVCPASNSRSRLVFSLLGVVSLLRLFVTAALGLRGVAAPAVDVEGADAGVSTVAPSAVLQFSCSLCLGVARSASALPCGHVMCWHCATGWLHLHAHCPVCRLHVQPSRLTPLVL